MSWRFAVNAQDSVAQAFGWQFAGANSNGHRTYTWAAPDGTPHLVVGYGNHQGDPTQDANKLRRLMKSCQNGTCLHAPLPQDVQQTPEVGQPILRPGDQVSYGNGNWWVMDVDGGLAHIYDAAGQEDIVPEQELKVAHVPDWVFTSHVVKRSELMPYNRPAQPWVPQVTRPGPWSTFNDAAERNVCPHCGLSMQDGQHKHDYCMVMHRRIAKMSTEEEISSLASKLELHDVDYGDLWFNKSKGKVYFNAGDGWEGWDGFKADGRSAEEQLGILFKTITGVKDFELLDEAAQPEGTVSIAYGGENHRKEAGREWEELPRYQEHPECPHCHRDALHFQYDEEGRPYLECAACEHEFMQDSGDGQLHDMTRGGGDWQAMPEFPEPTGETVPNYLPADWA